MGIYNFSPRDAFGFADHINQKSRRSGDELQLQYCPYCGGGKSRGDKYTFAISLKNGAFNCKREHCGAKGNMITLSRDFNYSLGRDVDEYYGHKKQYRRFRAEPARLPTPEAIAYLHDRGISERIVKKYGIITNKKQKNVLVFPFYDADGELTFIKYRKTDFDKAKDKNKEWCEPNCQPILFGMHQCNLENKTLVMTEGQIDSLSVAEAGIENAVSVPTGANGFTWVPYCWDFLGLFNTLVVFGDHEHGKITLLNEMRIRFHGTVKHVREEDYLDCKDANEILVKHGVDAVRRAVQNAEPLQHPRIKRLVDMERVNVEELEKFSTGIAALDKTIGGFYFGQLILQTGERGLGKSTLASQYGVFAIKAGYNVFFYSGELTGGMFKDWFERQVAGNRFINSKWDKYHKLQYLVRGDAIPYMEDWYGDHAYFYDNSILLDSEYEENETLLDTMQTAAKQYGCRVFFIDNLMTAIDDDIRSDVYRQQSNFTKDLARFAKEFNSCVILIAHPKKENSGYFSNDSVAGSSNITNLCDVVLRYAVPSKDNPTDAPRVLQVWKNRLDGKVEHEGIPLYYQDSSKRLSEGKERFDFELGWEDAKQAADGAERASVPIIIPDDDDSDLELDYEEL